MMVVVVVADHKVADHKVADHKVADHKVADHKVALLHVVQYVVWVDVLCISSVVDCYKFGYYSYCRKNCKTEG